MPEVEIHLCEFNKFLAEEQWRRYFALLSPGEQDRNRKYIRQQMQHSHLFGRLLLRNALIRHGYADDVLNSVRFSAGQKPFLDKNIYFNISHSGRYVGCAISTDIEVGLDIEQKRADINRTDFPAIFSDNELHYLDLARDKADSFCNLWTRKESVIKANGKGIAIDLKEVDVLNENTIVENKTWFLRNLELSSDYCMSLATSTDKYQLDMIMTDFFT
ncbi:MAG TPA: 4'-phosphopantetheinyl transferase superfamily protein [Puia sp.]|jgi:4'-phosphopantetheinyl transferase